MWPFKRKPSDDIGAIPEEIQDYYAAERRGRTGIAWLLALATLLTTLALTAALFFGGRWVYRKVHHGSTGTTSKPATTPPTPNQPVVAPKPVKKPAFTKPTPKTPKKVAAKAPSKPVPVAVVQPKKLSNTGSGDILGIFVVTTLVASTGHYLVKSKNS